MYHDNRHERKRKDSKRGKGVPEKEQSLYEQDRQKLEAIFALKKQMGKGLKYLKK